MATLATPFVGNSKSLAFRTNVGSTEVLKAQKSASTGTFSRQMPAVENLVKIRFTRLGRKKVPFYRIIAIDARDRREGKPLEFLGWYDPLKKETNLKAPEIKKWLSVGAQPTESVAQLLKKAMILE